MVTADAGSEQLHVFASTKKYCQQHVQMLQAYAKVIGAGRQRE